MCIICKPKNKRKTKKSKTKEKLKKQNKRNQVVFFFITGFWFCHSFLVCMYLLNKIGLTVYVEFSKNLRGICEEFSATLIKIEILFLSRIER